MTLRRILVAVEFPAEADQPGLDKALALAAGSGARVEVLHVAHDPGVGRQGAGTTQHDVDYVLDLRRAQLERLIGQRRQPGLRVSPRVEWGRPAHDVIVAAATATRADLVVGQTTRRGALRHLLTYTDWQLIRQVRQPLLLVKGADAWPQRPVLAAIDPLHAHDKPAVLDRAILDTATTVARAIGARVHAYHAYAPALRFVPGTALEPLPVLAPPADQKRHERAVRERVLRVTRPAGVAASRVKLDRNDAIRGLPEHARDLRAGIVVLGAVSRGLIARWLMGSTAEQVLDALSCDVLVVPPPPRRRRTRPKAAAGRRTRPR
ncbi:MAG: universal stress protein [Steroidobacteraceae bacterium]